MAGFHEVRFPTGISFGSTGGPMRRTDVVTLRSGSEERNSIWAGSLRRYDAGYGVRTAADLAAVVAFWEERRGRLYGFRWQDHMDFGSGAPGDSVAPSTRRSRSATARRDGVPARQDLRGGLRALGAPIRKPVAGTVRIGVGGSAARDRLDRRPHDRAVTFGTAPAAGAAITAGFLFDVPVRFDTDQLTINMSHFQAGQSS